MQSRLLKKIIQNYIEQNFDKLVDILYKKENVNEFLIAKKLNLTINQTRNILYKLTDEGMVSFIRKKDKKKGGWYTYFWTLETKKVLQKYKENLEKKIQNLQIEMKNRESERFYYCKNCCAEFDEENALLNNYTCPECGETVYIKEASLIIENIKKDIITLQKEIDETNREILEIEMKEEKVKQRRLKIEVRKKELERKKRRGETKKLKQKLELKKKKIKTKPHKKIKHKFSKKKSKKKKR